MGELQRILTAGDEQTLSDIQAGTVVPMPADEYKSYQKIMTFLKQHGFKLTEVDWDTVKQLREGWATAVSNETLNYLKGIEGRVGDITNDELKILHQIRAGEVIVFGAEEMVIKADPLQGDDPFTNYQIDQTAWSLKTFGPGARTAGILDHIRKELAEIEKTPYDLTEWIDVVILAMDGYWRHGGNVRMALELLKRKQAKNFARQWPDWRTMSEDVAIEHDRTGE